MADSEKQSGNRRPANRLAMALGVGACVVLIGGMGWYLWSNYTSDRASRVSEPMSSTPEAATPGPSAPNQTPNPASQQNVVAPAATPTAAGGNVISIQISAFQVTTQPDNLSDTSAGK